MPSEVRSASAYAMPPNEEWIVLPPETTWRHPLYGVSGWLIFFVLNFEIFIIFNVGNLIILSQLLPIPNQYLIIADTGFMLVILAMILTKFNFVGLAVWAWVSFHFLGLIFAYSEFGADGVVSEQEKIIIATYAMAFLLRDIPIAWYFTSSRRVNITMSSRVRPNDTFLRAFDQPHGNRLVHAEIAAQDDPVQGSVNSSQTEAHNHSKARYQTKECPACAEIIKSQARACRYCGYNFLNGNSTAEPSKCDIHPAIDTSRATKFSEKIEVPVVMNSVGLVEYRGFFIAEMDNGKFQILNENGEKLRKSGDYDSSGYAKATLDYFINIAVELMSYPASLPRTA